MLLPTSLCFYSIYFEMFIILLFVCFSKECLFKLLDFINCCLWFGSNSNQNKTSLSLAWDSMKDFPPFSSSISHHSFCHFLQHLSHIWPLKSGRSSGPLPVPFFSLSTVCLVYLIWTHDFSNYLPLLYFTISYLYLASLLWTQIHIIQMSPLKPQGYLEVFSKSIWSTSTHDLPPNKAGLPPVP